MWIVTKIGNFYQDSLRITLKILYSCLRLDNLAYKEAPKNLFMAQNEGSAFFTLLQFHNTFNLSVNVNNQASQVQVTVQGTVTELSRQGLSIMGVKRSDYISLFSFLLLSLCLGWVREMNILFLTFRHITFTLRVSNLKRV